MQRPEGDMIVIVCDFCRRDWDGVEPMIEGHHGSVLCLECLKKALPAIRTEGAPFSCTLCLREQLPGSLGRWQHDPAPAEAAPQVCRDCLLQAAKAFTKSAGVDWKWDGLLGRAPSTTPDVTEKESA